MFLGKSKQSNDRLNYVSNLLFQIFCENTEMYTGSDGVLVHTISLPRCHKEDCKPVVYSYMLLLHRFVSDIIPEFGYEHGRGELVPMKKNYYVTIEFMINSYTSTSASTGQIFKLQSKPSAKNGIDCCSIGSRLPLLFARNNYKGRVALHFGCLLL